MATGIKPNQNSVLFECLGGGYSLEKAKHKFSKQTATGQDRCHTSCLLCWIAALVL